MKFTGERFIPDFSGQEMQEEHYNRYYFARQFVNGKKVVDVACGEGYGTSILSLTAKEIYGLDISVEAVNNANAKYGGKNCAFQKASVEQLPFEDASVDVIVSFETIEHVKEDLQKKFLAEARRVLKFDGLLLISTPNKRIYSDKFHYSNEFHIHEFYEDEFHTFLSTCFKNICYFGQGYQVVNMIGNNILTKDYYHRNDKMSDNKYLIACCSNGSMNLDGIKGYIDLSQNMSFDTMTERILDLQNEEQERNDHIVALDKELAASGKEIVRLNEEIRKLGEWGNVTSKNLDSISGLLKEEKFALRSQQEAAAKELAEEKENSAAALRSQQEAAAKELAEEKENSAAVLRSQQEAAAKELAEEKENSAAALRSQQEAAAKELAEEKENSAAALRSQQEAAAKELAEEKENSAAALRNQQEAAAKELAQEKENSAAALRSQQEVAAKELAEEKENSAAALRSQQEKANAEIGALQAELGIIKRSGGFRMLLRYYRVRDIFFPPNSRRKFFAKLAKKFLQRPSVYLRALSWDNLRKLRLYANSMQWADVENKLDAYDDRFNGSSFQNVIVMEPGKDEAKKTYEQLVLPKFKKPLVSIVIPVYDQFDYTYLCLKSIIEHTKDIAYEVIIADDCSTDETKEIRKHVKNLVVVRNRKNLRFLRNCNNAAKYAKGKYIHFLNNDTQVQEDWLGSLVRLIESNEKYGMVGSKLVYPDGKLQEAGGILWKDGSAWNYGNRQDPNMPEYNYVKEADYISGASIMIKASLWKKIGGFDERFAPAYYEDTDLAFEVRKRGYKVMYQPKSVVVHFEGVSNGTDTSSGQKQYQIDNQKKFFEKWHDVLDKEHVPNAQDVFKAKDKSLFKKHILVVDHYIPNYDHDAGGRCTWMYLKLFAKLGLKVTFIGDNFAKQEPYTTELTQMGVEFLYGDWYFLHWKEWLRQNAHYFDYAYLNRPHISEKYIELLRQNSKCKIIYFGHDLHYLREKREYEITGNKEYLKSSQEWKKREFKLFNAADVIYVVGTYEQGIVQNEFPKKAVRNIPLYIYEEQEKHGVEDFENREDILFVGGFGHPPNEDAVLWFAENVFKKIVAKNSTIKWYIVGSHPTESVKALQSENIVITGFISDGELEKMYAKCRMAVVPLRYGAGVKGKVVEAAYNRIPLVTTPIGAEGLSLEEHAFEVYDCDENMADKILQLYGDFARLKELSENSVQFIKNHFTLEHAREVVLSDIEVI